MERVDSNGRPLREVGDFDPHVMCRFADPWEPPPLSTLVLDEAYNWVGFCLVLWVAVVLSVRVWRSALNDGARGSNRNS